MLEKRSSGEAADDGEDVPVQTFEALQLRYARDPFNKYCAYETAPRDY